MSGPGVGFEYPRKEVSWLKRDALLFANSIGCTADELHFLYVPFKGNTGEVVDFYAAEKATKIPGVPDFDSRRVVDGQRLIQFLKPLPTTSAGKKFEIRTKVLGVYDKGRPGTVVELQTDLVDAGTNEVYSRAIGSSFFVGQGNWGGPKGPATENFPPPKGKKPDVEFEDQTTGQTPLLYRLNGDYNPLHAHPEPGKKMGFGGVIIHGLYSFNSTCHGLLQKLGGSDPANIKEFQARFASPVRPGDKLVTSVWRTGEIKDGWEEIRFETKVAGGKVCLSNGKSKAATAASFVRPTRPADRPQSFVSALVEKYTAELTNTKAIQFSGKVAEEVGFEKIRRKQARLSELKFAILDGARIASVYAEGDEPIRTVCPKVKDLDLSRNLFRHVGTVVAICSELPDLRALRLNGNRFQGILEDSGLDGAESSFTKGESLALEETLMTWEEMCHVATRFPVLSTLTASINQLSFLPETPLSTLSSTLTSLYLELNDFTSISDIASLAGLKSLRNLHLKGNNISTLTKEASDTLPAFPHSLQYVDISYNQVSTWSFVDELPTCFPGLVSLRFAHNPIYDNPDPDFPGQSKNATEEAYMFTVGRLAKLKALNFGNISKDDRQNAEMFYLARIGKHLAAVPESQEHEVIKQHKRYAELCELYGPPVVNRKQEINPAFLEARLVTVQFVLHRAKKGGEKAAVERTTRIPKSFNIYAVKGIAGKLFGLRPLGLRLIWETGEWDPVAGFDDEVEDSSEEEDEGEGEARPDRQEAANSLTEGSQPDARAAGKWVKREVELRDGPRQLGFCVDGLEAKIRVEAR
ncbi:hypothetical protein DL771_001976 [Monosporascus sp. 5C6A]|nr:hypothetical protein DL771_001976 [Monosporascus sp. 5C6A]